MRRPKALVVHDDPRIVADLTDVSTSLGHTHDRACSQQGARQRLQTKKYSYLVLDLDIPARLKGGASHSQNGLNLLEQVRADPGEIFLGRLNPESYIVSVIRTIRIRLTFISTGSSK